MTCEHCRCCDSARLLYEQHRDTHAIAIERVAWLEAELERANEWEREASNRRAAAFRRLNDCEDGAS